MYSSVETVCGRPINPVQYARLMVRRQERAIQVICHGGIRPNQGESRVQQVRRMMVLHCPREDNGTFKRKDETIFASSLPPKMRKMNVLIANEILRS